MPNWVVVMCDQLGGVEALLTLPPPWRPKRSMQDLVKHEALQPFSQASAVGTSSPILKMLIVSSG